MKKRLNRVLSLLMTCALITSNIPVYAAGEDNSDTAAEVVAEDTIESETDDEADEAKAEQPAEEVVKDEETAAEDAVSEDDAPAAEDAAPAEDDTPADEEADAEDGEYVDITGECTIKDGVLSKYEGKDHAYISIPSSVSKIDGSAFIDHKEIKGVKFPAGLTDIGYSAFYGCTALELIELPVANPLVIQGNAFYNTAMGKGNNNGDLVIPANVTKIGVNAFSRCSMLGTVVFAGGDGSIELGATVFGINERLSKITLSERTPVIPENFAYGCQQLEEVVWNANLKTIGDGAFYEDVKLTSSDLSKTALSSIGYNAFGGCTMLPLVKFPESGSLEIGGNAFNRTSMNNGTDEGDLVIPANVSSIGISAFSGCPMLGTVEFAPGSNSIALANHVFAYNERLSNIKLSDRVTVIPESFANSCKLLTEVTWPATLVTISESAFNNDESLISSDLSQTAVTSIGYYAFRGCSALPLVKLPESGTLIIGNYAFNGTNMNDGMNAGELVIPSNVAEIGSSAFSNCSMLGKVTIKDGASAVRFGQDIFAYNNRLEKISLSNRVTELPKSFALRCEQLEEVVWPAELTTIYDQAFYGDVSLKSSDLSKTSITTVGYGAFQGCKALPLVKFPTKGSITIGNYAFADTAMNDGTKDGVLVIPACVKTIETFAFRNCSNLGEVRVEDGGSTLVIGNSAFYSNPRLVKIALSGRVSQIPSDFAAYCPCLTELSGATKVTKVNGSAFYVSLKSEIILTNVSQQVLGYDWAKDNRVLTDSACSVVFPEEKYTVEAGKTIKLDPVITVYPEGAAAPKLVWKSDGEAYATVDSNGNVKGVKETSGVFVTVETAEGIFKGRVIVQVLKKGEKPDPGPSDPIPGGVDPTDPQPLIKSDTASLILVKGQKFVLAEKDWKSSSKILKVKKGKAVAKKTGTATISRPGQTINVQIIEPSFESKSVKMTAGEEKQIALTNTGSLETYYTSTNPDVASVDADGNVTAFAKGKTVIQGYANGKIYKCSVTVNEFDTSAKTFADTVKIAPLQTVTVKAPGFNAKKASWSSSDQEPKTEGLAKGVVYEDAIVRITDKGKLTAIGAGSTTLTATGGGTELKFTVHVDEPLEKELHINVGGKKAFKLNGIKKQPDWNIEDATIASKDNKGKIIGAKAGETTMTGICENFEYTVKVFVENPALSGADGKPYNYSITIKKGETKELMSDGVYQPIAFKSNKSHIAFLGIDGKLYGRTKGSANITAKVNGKTVKLKVKVTD